MKKEKLPAGTKVRITGNSNAHGFKIGDIVTIRGVYIGPTDGFGYTAYRSDSFIVRDYDMEVVEEETLLEQAKRLYPVGTKFKNAIVKHNGREHTVTKCDPEEVSSGIINISATDSTHGRACIYYKGKWAEIIKEETLLEQAKKKYPVGTRYKSVVYSGEVYVVEEQTFKHANGNIHGEDGKGILYRDGKWAEIIKEETLLEKAQRLYPIGTKFRTSKTGVLRTVASTITVYTKSPLILACETEESYRWSEVYTEGKWGEIITETKTDIVMSTTQTATRAQLKSIHSKVCSKWQSRIEETIKLDMFADSFEIPNGLITQAFDEADKEQTALLLEIFTKPDNGYVTLATGDFEANVFETNKIVIGLGAVPKEFRGKSIIFDSSMYEAIIMPNTHLAGELDTMIVFKKK
jgi:hypothetical protein